MTELRWGVDYVHRMEGVKYVAERKAMPFSYGGNWGDEPHGVYFPDGTKSKPMTQAEALEVAKTYNILFCQGEPE